MRPSRRRDATGILKAPAPKAPEKATSDTARHPALKLAAKAPRCRWPPSRRCEARGREARHAGRAESATPVAAKPAASLLPRRRHREQAGHGEQHACACASAHVLRSAARAGEAQRTAPSAPFHVGKGVGVQRHLASASRPSPPRRRPLPRRRMRLRLDAKPKIGNAAPLARSRARRPRRRSPEDP